MTTSIYDKKKFLYKISLDGSYFNIIKAKWKTHSEKCGKNRVFPLRGGTWQECLLSTSIPHQPEVIASEIRQEKEMKCIKKMGEEKVKLLSTANTILCREKS